MKIANRTAFWVLALATSAALASAANVFVVPASQFENSVAVFTADPFQSTATLTATDGLFTVLAKPDGSKFYLVSSHDTDAIVVYDGSLSTKLHTISLPQPAVAAAISPDGKRLLVLAGGLHIYDTTKSGDDEIIPNPIPSVGQDPFDLTFSLDSTRAYILSETSHKLYFFDLGTNKVVGSGITVNGTLTGVATGPNGYIYVSGQNQLVEIDGSGNGSISISIGVNALPGKPVFTPDGLYAVVANQTPQTTDGLAILLDLTDHVRAATIPNTGNNLGLKLDGLSLIDESTVYAVSTSTQRLVKLTISPFNLQQVGFPFATKTGIMVSAPSMEAPAKYLFAGTSGTISRAQLSNSQTQDLSIPEQPGALVLAGAASTATPVSWRKYNDGQTVIGGSTTAPLVLRVFDANGMPVFGRSVQFSAPTGSGVTFDDASTTTSSSGFAMTRATTPTTAGALTITAAVDGLATPVTFTVTVAGGGGGGGAGGVFVYSGNGQIVPRGFTTNEPIQVQVLDSQGKPIKNATVTWAIASGGQGSLTGVGGTAGPTSKTDANGIAGINYVAPGIIGTTVSWIQSTVTASVTNLNTVDFTVTAFPTLPGGASAIPTVLLQEPPQGNRVITGQAGQTLAGAVQMLVTAVSGTKSGQGVPGIGIEIDNGSLDPTTSPTARCADPTRLSGNDGIGVCDVVLGPVPGNAKVTVSVGGGQRTYDVQLQVTPPVPAKMVILGGNNQSGTPSQVLPVQLQAQVQDSSGNPLAAIPVTWTVTPLNGVTLTGASTQSDSNGKVGATATLGPTAGNVQVKVQAGAALATFNITINPGVANLSKVSGDNQQTLVNTAFSQPVVVMATDSNGAVVAGTTVSFSASGGATLGSASQVTTAQGLASTTVTAGSTAGAITVTATAGSASVTFTLTAIPPGPVVSLSGIRNSVSGDAGVSPGAIIAIYGTGLAPGINGSVVANNFIGPLSYNLAGVTVKFGSASAPLYSVNNINGQEWIVVQAPFSLAAPGSVSVTIQVNDGSTTVSGVPVKEYQPGIFESLAADGSRYAVLLKEDGSYVSPTHAANRGERIRMFVAGLGQTSPALDTNMAGIDGQSVLATLLVGINNAGVPVLSAQTMVGVVGVYILTFDVPADTATGPQRPFAIAIYQPSLNKLLFGNPSTIAIQ